MKKILCALLVLIFLFSTGVSADYDPGLDYLTIACTALSCGDHIAGRAAAICHNERLEDQRIAAVRVDYDALMWLSKLIEHEAGSRLCGVEWRMCVGEVVLNRVASSEFPDSIEEVIFQKGQYAGVDCDDFRYELNPDELSIEAALRLLQGERLMAPQVVFQAYFEQGSGVYRSFENAVNGTMYFCISNNPALYGRNRR